MRAGIIVKVTPEDRRWHEAILLDRSASQKHVWRTNIIIATAGGYRGKQLLESLR